MSILLVTCDLKNPARDYRPLLNYLHRLPHCKPTSTTWLLETEAEVTALRDQLRQLLDHDDSLLVAHLQLPSAWFNLDTGGWLSDPKRRW